MTRWPNLDRYPFYRERMGADGVPAPWTLADLETFRAAHPDDPFAGRVLSSGAKLSIQFEATGEPPIWGALNPPEADEWAGALARMWARWGANPGEAIAFFDYGSSPLVLLASSGYVGYLRHGAAERLGLTAICNDGVATMAPRMVTIIEAVHPSMLIIRRDLAAPLISALESAGLSLAGRIRWVAVSEVDGTLTRAEADRIASALGVPVFRIFRSDPAFLLAGECPDCRAFHLDRVYRAEALDSGEIAISTAFSRSCPAVRYNAGAARILGRGCALDPKSERMEC